MRFREFQTQGAGCLLVAQDTGRWCLQQRSDSVSDPGVWSTWGGGREPGESLEQTVRRELAEEAGYHGPLTLYPLSENRQYVTFVGVVPQEFEPRSCSEWKDYCWVDQGQWPQPLHHKLMPALNLITSQVVEVVAEGEGFDQEAGIGIDGKSFKFKIRDLVAFAEKYPVTKIDPNQFADQLAGREEDPAQSMARVEKADLQYPIIVVKRKNGQLWIADGTHRAHKAILNKLPAIQAKIIPIKDMTPFAVKQAVAEGSEKIFTVVYYSKRTDRTVTKPIKASSESKLWDRLRAKDIDVISVEEQGVAEDWRQDNYKQRGINSIMDLVTPAIREKKSLDGWISGIYNYIEDHNMENDPRWIRAEKNAKSMKTKWFIDNDMPTFNTNPKLARQGEVMFFKELIKNLANEFGQQGVAEQQDDPYRTNTEQNMDSVAQFEVGQKVIFTSPLNNKKYEAVVKNIWPDTGSIEVFIPLGDQGGGLGTFASPKNLQPMQQEVAEGKKCNHTMEGTQCPVHGLSECPMQENKKLKETSAGSVAGVNNPPGKNSGKKKSQIGSLFGGTYKQTVHETDFAGEKTTPPQKPGDQVRGTEKPIKKGKQQPFYHRLVGNE